jgi:hypothetical protein
MGSKLCSMKMRCILVSARMHSNNDRKAPLVAVKDATLFCSLSIWMNDDVRRRFEGFMAGTVHFPTDVKRYISSTKYVPKGMYE